jgi:lipopolysaccharide/colanic/teichoic acid biosynthesis glycosyltransferase
MSTVKIRLPWRNLQGNKRGKGAVHSNALFGLYSPEQTAVIIERERARTDRTESGFSLLVITGIERRQGKAALLRFADYLTSRVRLTDEVGWLADHKLGIVLPATQPSGARRLVELLRHERADANIFDYKVYYYPSDDQFDREVDFDSERRPQAELVHGEPMEPLFAQPTRIWKRCLDVVGAVIALTLLSPAFILASIAIRLTSPGPILFAQLRSGRGGVPFRMYKFRSMVVDAEQKKESLRSRNEQDGPAFKIRSDPRVTWIGRLLRKSSVDELPQLWNVLKGEMSLVGPRPLPCDETLRCESWRRRRLDVKPGMTCIWQLHGRSAVSFDTWMRMDISYIRKLSLMGDVKLLAATVPVLVWRRSGC